MVRGAPEIRAEVLRVLHKAALGMPALTTDDLAGQPLSPAELGLMNAAEDEDLALLNALLAVEAELREAEFATVERLLVLTRFAEGELDERLLALPDRTFGRAASDLYALGWVNTNKEE